MIIAETKRLIFREIEISDAPFILEFLNTPDYIKNIVDRNVRSLADAEKYILADPIYHYNKYGYGSWLMCIKDGMIPIGTCGIKQRDFIDFPDLGYGLLPSYYGKGYAYEAALAVIDYVKNILKLDLLYAFLLPENTPSLGMIKKLNFRHLYNYVSKDINETLSMYRLKLKDLSIDYRKAKEKDLNQINTLFKETIQIICNEEYDKDQRNAWQSGADDLEKWTRKINNQYFIVAEYKNKIVGFASLEKPDCLDMMYVHHNYIRLYIADRLASIIEYEAIKLGAIKLSSDASKTALPFFQKSGYKIISENVIIREKISLTNYRMEKKLAVE